LTVEISSDNETWESEISLQVQAPNITFENSVMTIANEEDDILEPGETAEIYLQYQNQGSGYSYNLSSTLFSYNADVSISGNDIIPQINPGENALTSQPFSINILQSCTVGEFVQIEILAIDELGNGVSDFFRIPIGFVSYNFENDTDLWTHIQLTDDYTDEWHLSNFRNYTENGLYSMKFGGENGANYSTYTYGALLMPERELSANNYLSFRQWLDVPTINDSLCYDGGLVEISIDGGEFEQLEPNGGYPAHAINLSTSPFEFETPLFAGHLEWEEAEFDLSAYSGTAQIRFVFGSASLQTGEGWYIDDVKIGKYEGSKTENLQLMNNEFQFMNYPNPFRNATTISFEFSTEQNQQNEQKTISIYNIKGQIVKQLKIRNYELGINKIIWDGKDEKGNTVNSGIYFYKLIAGNFNSIKKMILIK